jgi:hypothetical protein
MDNGWPPDGPREATANFGDSVHFEDRFDATIATPLHPLLLEAAEQAAARSAAAAGTDLNEELKEACVAILAAAVAVETGTHWAAYTHSEGLLAGLQELELARKWQSVVRQVSGVQPTLGEGIGQAVSNLAVDRNRIAHSPSRGHDFFSAPQKRSGGMSAIRTHFDARRAGSAVGTARKAIAMLQGEREDRS